ncbi:MAG TPA: DUF3857 domain-containing protein [Terriglobales bacterium]|nr:DUF3857 domain-containing protein [Terriglobales bacterium]
MRQRLCLLFFAFSPALLFSQIPEGSPFTASPVQLLQAGQSFKSDKPYPATVLLDEHTFTFQSSGVATEERHLIYRVNSAEGVGGWSETSAEWQPWRQKKPEIRARVITADGSVHELDPQTLTDVPLHEDSPDLYSDGRRFGGPLPAVAEGSVVED